MGSILPCCPHPSSGTLPNTGSVQSCFCQPGVLHCYPPTGPCPWAFHPCCLPGVCLWGRALEHRDVPAPCVAPGLAQLCCFSFVLYNEINFYSPSVHSPCLCAVLGPVGVPTAGRSPEGGGCPPIWAKLWGFGVQAEAWFLDEALALLSSTQHCATSLPAPVSQWQLFPRPFLSLQAPSQALDTRNTVSVQERDFPCTSPGSYGSPRDG